MDEVYQTSSTEKVQQLEQELAAQLAELKAEIEDNRILQGIPSRAYSDDEMQALTMYPGLALCFKEAVDHLENMWRKTQAGVVQRELESCRRREPTAANGPCCCAREGSRSLRRSRSFALAQQVALCTFQNTKDRITQLVQSKYLRMLRWKRFCMHSSVIEQLYPLYQKCISHIMEEYNDAVQRAASLSAARKSFLTGKNNLVNVVTREDLMIDTRWLVCHLHSLKGIHCFLQKGNTTMIKLNVEYMWQMRMWQIYVAVVQDNWDKLRSAFDKNSDTFNIDVFPFSRVLRRNGWEQRGTELTGLSLEKQNPSLLGTRQGVRLLLAVKKWAGQGGGMKRGCALSSPSPFSTEDLCHKGCTCGSARGSRAQPWPGVALPSQWQLIENRAKESADSPGADMGPLALGFSVRELGRASSSQGFQKESQLNLFFKGNYEELSFFSCYPGGGGYTRAAKAMPPAHVSNIDRVMEGLQEHTAAVFEPHPVQSSSTTSSRAS
ncbi:hypothetical protein QYF61_013673 [Mycteria americana]|uniref:DUF4549 domain-containing protein n=1 Tax=Mycteria americana TaxID=33587 RepID=A0AAN7NA67_MYCAM|nr:hypothetical protein QYF61_013673 [Mycteria americana]